MTEIVYYNEMNDCIFDDSQYELIDVFRDGANGSCERLIGLINEAIVKGMNEIVVVETTSGWINFYIDKKF